MTQFKVVMCENAGGSASSVGERYHKSDAVLAADEVSSCCEMQGTRLECSCSRRLLATND